MENNKLNSYSNNNKYDMVNNSMNKQKNQSENKIKCVFHLYHHLIFISETLKIWKQIAFKQCEFHKNPPAFLIYIELKF